MTVGVIVLGLATAMAYGASDFLGGLAARQARDPLAIVVMLKLVAAALFLGWMLLTWHAPNLAAAGWGGIAGVAIGLAYIAYFRGLAASRMGIVATIAATWAAVVPLLAGVLLGERPSALAWTGIAAIASSIVLITYTREASGAGAASPDPALPATHPTAEPTIHCAVPLVSPHDGTPASSTRLAEPPARPFPSSGLVTGSAAGIGFGMFFVALDRASAAADGGGLSLPLLVATATAAIVVGAVGIARRVDWSAARAHAPVVVAAGILYAAGSLAFMVAVDRGWISIVAVLAALSPAPTILLARLLLSESLTARQLFGAALAIFGVALVTGGLPD